MERISAACAMEWSIELEKALRSKNPGRAIETILLTGLRLEQWSQESEANQTMCSMFGLLPHEDRLFANTILLRLADAFVSGDKKIRRSIVKVFFSYARHRRGKKMRKGAKGILSMGRVQNHVELLRKVKLVFESGDVESRALCLFLLGCWADFAKDSADIRYLILSSVVSSHIQEVKASLFAAGCFCELAEDFANVVLEMLVNMVTSAEIPTATRLAGARVFAKMSCSSLVAKRAYRTGMQLVSGASEENFIGAMLVSLSKLASQSTILISEQVDLLFSCLNQAKNLQLQSIALRCLYFIFVRKQCCMPVTEYMVKALTVIMDQPELQSSMQIGAIKILHKVLLCSLSQISYFEVDEYSKLLTVLEIASQSSVLPKSVVAVHILANLSTRLRGKTETESAVLFSSPSPSWYIYEARPVTREVHEKLELLNEQIQHFDPFDHSSLAMCSILMYSRILYGCTMNRNKSLCNLDSSSDVALPILVECEILTLPYAEKMLRKMDKWSVYRAGIYAATHGEWLVAAFMFGQLSTKVQSDSCSCWLKLLVLFSDSEKNIQILFLPKEQSNLVNWSALKHLLLNPQKEVEPAADVAANIQKRDWSEVLLGAQCNLCSLGKSLDAINMFGIALCFQRWFLALRAKVLGAAGEIFEVLERFKQEHSCENPQVDICLSTHCDLVQKVIQLSLQVNRLAQEFDLLNGSFHGMDCQSSKTIAALALNCSVLAFAAGFPLFIQSILDHETSLCYIERSQPKSFSVVLLMDLVRRLSLIDSETTANLCFLSDSIGWRQTCLHLQSRNQRVHGQCEIKDILCIARCTVSGILDLHNETNQMHTGNVSQSFNKGFELLFDTLMKWIKIPIRVPKSFFIMRPCFGSELYASSASSRDPDRVTMLPGSHLCLNLCLQLKNVPPGLLFQHTKLYCLIHSRLSYQQKGQRGGNDESGRESQPWECDEMVEMNDKLFHHVTQQTKETSIERSRHYEHDVREASAFVCFDLNARGQGYTNCLLDVSKFPPGSYRIKWYSSFVDKLGAYWNILSLNSGPTFVVEPSTTA